jgi:hypothetical protein
MRRVLGTTRAGAQNTAMICPRSEQDCPANLHDRVYEPYALGALDLDLTAEELAELEEALPPDAVAGERYNAQQMALLDSERRPTITRRSRMF